MSNKIYVCGPMTPTRFDEEDRSDHTYAAFGEAEETLEAAGHTVYNPATNFRGGEWDDSYDPLTSEEWASLNAWEYRHEYRRVMERDLRWIMECDGVCLLPGWRNSVGARFEHDVACMLQKEITNTEGWVAKTEKQSETLFDTPMLEEQPSGRVIPRVRAEARPAWDELVHEGKLEVPHHFGDAGHDLVCTEDVRLESGDFRDVDCDLRVALPEGTWGLITGRSSTFRDRGLHVVQGVIDNGYRGPVKVGVWNTGRHKQWIVSGDQLAQLILMPLLRRPLRAGTVEKESEDGRGEAGFGSTRAG